MTYRNVGTIVSKLTNQKYEGTYLEFDAKTAFNSSFNLEKEFRWKGLSLDPDPNMQPEWEANRKNKLVTFPDYTLINYTLFFRELMSVSVDPTNKKIDYLYAPNWLLSYLPLTEYPPTIILVKGESSELENYNKIATFVEEDLVLYVLKDVPNDVSISHRVTTDQFLKNLKPREIIKLNGNDIVFLNKYVNLAFSKGMFLDSEKFDMSIVKTKLNTVIQGMLEEK